jgi:hypothetical protein
MVDALLATPGVVLTPEQDRCVHDALASARELAMGWAENNLMMILRFEPSGFRSTPTACLFSMDPLRRTSVEGATEAYVMSDDVMVLEPGLMLIGAREDIQKALAAKAPGAWPAGLDLAADQYVAFKMAVSHAKARAGLTVTPTLFRFDIRMELRDEQRAKGNEERMLEGLRKATERGPQELADLVRKIRIERRGSRMLVSFELAGSTAQQAEQLSKTAALAVAQVREYIANSKKKEATLTIMAIALAYNKALAGAAPAGRGRPRLFSLPAVPKQIPSGSTHQSTEDEWKAWTKIGYRKSDPQYYQYEVMAAPNGASAEIVARGDLDGDGKASSLTLHMQLDAGELQIGSEIVETDPLE